MFKGIFQTKGIGSATYSRPMTWEDGLQVDLTFRGYSICLYFVFSKKISTFSRSGDWNHALNYVAKRYIDPVDREVYFQDVQLQMDAKVWGEEYNRHNPPKKVKKTKTVLPLYDLVLCVVYQ